MTIDFDVSPLVPEARRPALAAARVYWKHTQPWFIGLLVHGSALKGGFIPGCSDIDCHLYLDQAAFEPSGQLPLALALAIHRDLAQIDPAPFAYFQCYALSPAPVEGQRGSGFGVIPGTYHLIAGQRVAREFTGPEVLQMARDFLASFEPGHRADNLLEHGDGRLEREVRYVCTEVWPALYHVLTCRTPDDPASVWRLPKEAAMARLPEDEPCGREIRRFYRMAWDYYTGDRSVDGALALYEQGVRFLQAAREWYLKSV